MSRSTIFLIDTVFLVLLDAAPAWAPGSIEFHEVMNFARQNQKLVREIETTMKQEKVQTKDIGCTAARFGNQWKYLGGGRSIPFTCQIGKRELTIDGDVEYLDEKGGIIKGGLENPQVFSKARHIRETTPTWKWSAE